MALHLAEEAGVSAMKLVPGAIGLSIVAMFAVTGERGYAGALETGPVKIEVLFTEHGNLQYYALSTKSYQSQFLLHYYEYRRRPPDDDERTKFLVFNLPGSAGRQLTTAFEGLKVSWNSREYYWLLLREHFAELPEDRVPCGMVAFAAEQVVACPLSAWASANKSIQSNHLAWFIRLLEVTRYQFAEAKRDAAAEQSRDALLGLLKRIDSNFEVEAGRDGPGANRRIPAGLMLRATVAEALVHGGLLDEPMSLPEFEIRQAAVEWYADRLSQKDARLALLQALRDTDSRVRAAAATALASDVAKNDSATIEAIRDVLKREPDPFVRQVIQELLDGNTP